MSMPEKWMDEWKKEYEEIEAVFRLASIPSVLKKEDFDKDIKPGQIRKLHVSLLNDSRRFQSVLVLRRWIDDMWLVTPISHMSIPCYNEIKINNKLVLEVWNTRSVEASILEASKVTEFVHDTIVLNDCDTLFTHLLSGKEYVPSGKYVVNREKRRMSAEEPECIREYFEHETFQFDKLTHLSM